MLQKKCYNNICGFYIATTCHNDLKLTPNTSIQEACFSLYVIDTFIIREYIPAENGGLVVKFVLLALLVSIHPSIYVYVLSSYVIYQRIGFIRVG